MLAVTFCVIGWLNVSVGLCVFCSSVFFCEKKNIFETRCGVFSLTELTDLTEPFCALFRTHRTPPAYRIHRTLLPKVAVRFCEIGWLNVSVGPCVFCSSVFSVRKRTLEKCRGKFLLSQRIFFSLTERTEFTEPFGAQFRVHRRPSAYRVHRALLLSLGWCMWKRRVNKMVNNHYSQLS